MVGAWSVKGIDPKARAAARDLATARGQTLGELLNDLLLEVGTTEPSDSGFGSNVTPFSNPSYQQREPSMQTTPETERVDDATRLARALERLSSRIEASETRSALAIAGMDQSVLGLVARIDNTDRVTQAVAGRVDRSMEEMKSTHTALIDRVRRIESDNSGRQSLDAMRSLEQALGRLAAHVYTQDEKSATDTAALKRELAASVARLETTAQSVDTKVDQALGRATAQVEAIADKAELRAHGATRDLSDKVRDIEARIAQRMAELETRLGEGASGVEALGGLEASLNRIQSRLAQAEGTTDAAIKGLEASFNSLDSKIAALSKAGAGEELRQIVERRFEGLAESLTRSVTEARADMARQIEDATKAMRPESLSRLEYSLENVQARLAQAETKQAQTMAAISEELKKVSKVMGQRLRNVEGRNDGAAAESVREELSTVTKALEGRLVEIEAREARAIETVGVQVANLAEKLERRVEDSEAKSAKAITEVGEHMARMTLHLQARQEEQQKLVLQEIKGLEGRQETRLSDALAGVTERLASLHSETRQAVSPVHTALAALAKRMESIEAFNSPPGLAVPPPIETSAFAGFTSPPPSFDVPKARKVEPPPSYDDEFSALDDVFASDPAPLPSVAEEAPAKPTARGKDPFDFGAALDRLQSGAIPPPSAAIEPPPIANDHDFENGAFVADVPPIDREEDEFDAEDDREDDSAPENYLNRARRAANDSLTPERHKAKATKQPRAKTHRLKKQQGQSGSKTPLILAASVVALTVVGTAAYVLLNRPSSGGVLPWAPGAENAGTEAQGTGTDPMAAPTEDGATEASPDATPTSTGTASPDTPVVAVQTPAVARVSAEPRRPADAQVNSLSAERGTLAPPVPSRVAPPPSQTAPQPLPQATINRQGTASAASLPPPPAQVMPVVQAPRPATPGQPVTLEAAAAQGDAISQFLLGNRKASEGDFAAAATLLQRAAVQNMPAADYRLAKLYERGQGVPRDMTEAKRRTERAAVGGHVKAMHDLGMYYAEGEVAPQSYVTAVEWFKKAANFGLVDSQFNLGLVYAEGHGVAVDPAEALFWLEVARRNGDPEAQRRVASATAALPPAEAEPILARAAAFRPRVSDPAANGRFTPDQFAANGSQRVMDLQRALARLGYEPGVADGVLTAQTRVAIQRFQRAQGQPETGQISDELMRQVLASGS
jgi:localization factor PodJL